MRPDLAALVGSRICHDLISPIGAISNGVELLSMSDSAPSAEMQLISDSVDNASARIRFFRIAFGAAAPDQMVSGSEVKGILAAMSNGGRFQYDWGITEEPRRLDVRLAFLLMQCFETALPSGGQVSVVPDGLYWRFVARGTRINAVPELWDTFGRPAAGDQKVSPAQVHFALLPDAVAEAGRNLRLDISDTEIEVRV